MAGSDITVEILKDIRDDIRGVRTEFRELLEGNTLDGIGDDVVLPGIFF